MNRFSEHLSLNETEYYRVVIFEEQKLRKIQLRESRAIANQTNIATVLKVTLRKLSRDGVARIICYRFFPERLAAILK